MVAAGGFIEFGRVNGTYIVCFDSVVAHSACIGNLALARALGDFEYKKNKSLSAEAQIITCDPEITEHKLTDDDEFIVIACDGV